VSLSIKPEWITKALDSAEKEAIKLRPESEIEVRASAEHLRAVRDQIARLGEGSFRAGLSLYVTSQSTDSEVMAAFSRVQAMTPGEVSSAKLQIASESSEARRQHDQDVREVLAALKAAGQVLLPLLLAAL
jgi:hypothetical protein